MMPTVLHSSDFNGMTPLANSTFLLPRSPSNHVSQKESLNEMVNLNQEIPSGPPKASVELAALLQNDTHLTEFNLVHLATSHETPDQHAVYLEGDSSNQNGVYAYASWLLMGNTSANTASTDAKLKNSTWSTTQATIALDQVERKLQLIQQLSQRISREKPEDVAGPLLRLHGYSIVQENSNDHATLDANQKENTTSLSLRTMRDRCDRLVKQSQVYEGIAARVETTLSRALKTFHTSTLVLQRLINVSRVLKVVMKLRFEAWKVMDVSSSSSSLDLFLPMIASTTSTHPVSSNASVVDLRELTRAAASVSVMKELLHLPEIQEAPISIVEQLRPEVDRLIRTIRTAAAKLMEDYPQSSDNSDPGDLVGGNHRNTASIYLSAALQVYYSLGELPSAVWLTVGSISDSVEKATGAVLNPAAMQRLVEAVKSEAKALATKEESAPSNLVTGLKTKTASDPVYERMRIKVLKEKRAQAASKVANATLEACLQVWNLQRVLMRKSDPVTRQNYFNLVCQNPVPERFRFADELSSTKTERDSNCEKQRSIFTIFFNGLCISLGSRLQKLLKYDNGVISREVAALYPFIRSEYLGVVKAIHDVMQASSTSSFSPIDLTSGFSNQGSRGILGGSSSLNEAGFFSFIEMGDDSFQSTQSDSWTTISMKNKGTYHPRTHLSHHSSALASIYASNEWNSLQGSGSSVGLQPLQQAFIAEVQTRLKQPLENMFPESVNVDENGIMTTIFPLLPSKYDLEKLEKRICDVLAEGDPKMGEFSLVKLLTECVVETVEKICALAKNASSGAHDESLMKENLIATENLVHDLKVANIMDMLRSSLRAIPDKTFVAPYRPADSALHHEAANICQITLLPAIHEIDGMVKTQLLYPIMRFVNRRLAVVIGTIHRGIYLEALKETGDSSFVERCLSPLYNSLQVNVLSKLPSDYASFVAASVAVYSIICFISNVALVRPIRESARLRVTQDLADLELILEQFTVKAGSNSAIPLHRINGGKPYAELRAVRQLLFWNGFDSSDTVEKLASDILRENWIKDMRPSTIIHFLASFGPKLFSSPHHIHRLTAGEYVMNNLLTEEGSSEDGEVNAWLTILNCCDSYQQRESLDSADGGGDKRVIGLLHIVGPELLKRARP